MNRYKAKIDISKSIDIYFDVPLFTGDSGNSVELSFFMRGEPYNMTGVTVSAKRADGQTVFDMGSISGNTAQYTIANNMHNIPGNLDVQISLSDSTGAFLTSGFLHFSVEKGFSEDSGIEADDRYPIFNTFSEELNKKANLSGGNAFSGDQTMYGDVSMYSHVHMGGDLYVTQGAVIDNVDAWNSPGLEVNHYPMTGEEQPCVRFKSGNVEIANLDHTGQLWKGDKKYVTETELGTKANLAGGNIFNGDNVLVGHQIVDGDLNVNNQDFSEKTPLVVKKYWASEENGKEIAEFYDGDSLVSHMDTDGQLWKGNEKYITGTELSQAQEETNETISQTRANALVSDTAESETLLLSDQQPDTHMNTFTVYGVSQQDGTPTPDTPAEVVSAEDFDVVCSGKNLINESNQWYDQYGYISSTFADGVWTITNTSGSGQTAQLDIGVLPAGTYAINAVNYGRTMAIFAGSTQIWGSDTFPKTFTLSENREDVRLCAFPGANKSITVSNLQLELGSAATQYTPYIAPYTGHITGAMRGIPKTGGWAFRDYIESDGTSVWKVQECGYAVLTGAESWSVSANTIADGIIFYTILSGQDKSVTPKYSLLSNRFTALKDGSALKLGNISQTNVTFFAAPNTDTGITSEDTDAVKLQKYKAWLAENNVTILYQLASPVRTDITETEAGRAILSAVRTKNIVSVRTENLETNTVNPLYQANYNQDINKVINELKQIIVSLGGVIS
nr:MAG TPA: BppU domain protein [Caudoviricetes sp.]